MAFAIDVCGGSPTDYYVEADEDAKAMSILAEQVRRFGFITPVDLYFSEPDAWGLTSWRTPLPGRTEAPIKKSVRELDDERREERRLSRQADIEWAASTTLEARRKAAAKSESYSERLETKYKAEVAAQRLKLVEKGVKLLRRARKPERLERGADWEALRANRLKVEKECIAFLKQQATVRLERQEKVEKVRLERQKTKEGKLTRGQLEWSLGMSIKRAKMIYTPGPLCADGSPNTGKWIVGRHAHPALWDWSD